MSDASGIPISDPINYDDPVSELFGNRHGALIWHSRDNIDTGRAFLSQLKPFWTGMVTISGMLLDHPYQIDSAANKIKYGVRYAGYRLTTAPTISRLDGQVG